jgi:phenylacetic acid degradation operon negative regulatory protein
MLQLLIAVINSRITPTREARPGADISLRPLSPRSIVLSVLLGTHPPAMRAAPLIEFTSLFGISEGSLRTALSRMVAAGELAVDDGVYRLSGRLLERQREQDTGRHGPPPAWDGSWWFAAVLADRRSVADRRAFRADALAARFGELRPDTWLRPANIEVAVHLRDTVVTRGPLVHGDPHALVGRLWDLDGLGHVALEHHRRLAAAATTLADAGPDAVLADVFMALAAAQRFLRTEPQLPAELAGGTHATDLRERYDQVATAFQRRLAAFLRRRDAPIGGRATR